MTSPPPIDGDAIVAALAEQADCLDAVCSAFVSLAHALLLAGVQPDELRRLLTLAVETSA